MQLPVLGFSNFPNVSAREAVGDCHLVMTRKADGKRRLLMMQNRQERGVAVKEHYNNFTKASGCACWHKKGAEVREEQDFQATRHGYQALYIFSVDHQLLNMWSEVVTRTSMVRSRHIQERSLEVAYCGWRCCLMCCCPCLQQNACHCCPLCPRTYFDDSTDGSGSSAFHVDSADKAKVLDELVCRIVTQDAEERDDIATRIEFAQYYAVQFRFANPETSKMHEVIAVAHPEVGQTKCMQFVSLAMDELHLTKITETARHEMHYTKSSDAGRAAEGVTEARKVNLNGHKVSTQRTHVKWMPHPTLYEDGDDPFTDSRDDWHHKNFGARGVGDSSLVVRDSIKRV